MSDTKNIFRIPSFLQASTKENLIKEMLKNNISKNAEHDYFDIQKDGPLWVVWYYTNITPMVAEAKIQEVKKTNKKR